MSEGNQSTRMFLQGGTCSVDGLGRIFLPNTWRLPGDESGHTEFILAPGYDRSIAVYTLDAYRELYDDKIRRAWQNATAQNWISVYSDSCQKFVLDKQGRFVISEMLRRYAGIEKKAQCVGTYSYGRIFCPEHWKEIRLRNQPAPELSAEEELSLSEEEQEFLCIQKALAFMGNL